MDIFFSRVYFFLPSVFSQTEGKTEHFENVTLGLKQDKTTFSAISQIRKMNRSNRKLSYPDISTCSLTGLNYLQYYLTAPLQWYAYYVLVLNYVSVLEFVLCLDSDGLLCCVAGTSRELVSPNRCPRDFTPYSLRQKGTVWPAFLSFSIIYCILPCPSCPV